MLPTLDLSCEENVARVVVELTTGHWASEIVQAEILKMQKHGQFPDELVKIKGAQMYYVNTQTY